MNKNMSMSNDINLYVERLESLQKKEIRNNNWSKVKSLQYKIDNSNMTTTKRGIISHYINEVNKLNNKPTKPNRKQRRLDKLSDINNIK